MIIKTLHERVKTIYIPQEIDGEIQKIPVDKVVGYNICRFETDVIFEFAEINNPRTNKPYKSRSYLSTPQGYIVVKHSFDELLKFKKDLHQRIEIKGFLK